MKRGLTLKKVTLRDLDDGALKKVAGGDETQLTCDPSGCTLCMTINDPTCRPTIDWCYCSQTCNTCAHTCAGQHTCAPGWCTDTTA